LLEEAQKEETRLKTERAVLQKKETELPLIPDMKQREEAGKQLRAQQSGLAEQEIEARKKFADRQANMAKDVYTKFKAVIDTIAKTYSLDLVISYPDATSKEEEDSPQQAFRMLSAPGAMILWKNASLDITETVIKYLNHNFQAPAGYTPGTKSAPALTPMK
jgi:Skp family chaperone for outer membrane proteins